MRIWKNQSKFTASTIQGRSVAVRVWDHKGDQWSYDIVKVSEVSPSGLEFASFDGFKWQGFDVADIRRVF